MLSRMVREDLLRSWCLSEHLKSLGKNVPGGKEAVTAKATRLAGMQFVPRSSEEGVRRAQKEDASINPVDHCKDFSSK
jgi:hypothetical protein